MMIVDDDDDTIIVASKSVSSVSRGIINPQPIAVILEPYEYNIDEQPITLDGSESYDPNGYITKYDWHLGDGTSNDGEIITHEYTSAGKYYVTLEVTDDRGAHGEQSKEISIIQPNRAPMQPIIGGIIPTIQAGKEYSYAAISNDLDGDDLKYIFDWGDGNTDESDYISLPKGTAYNMIHTWAEPGTYTITVTVTDGELASAGTEIIDAQEPPLISALGLSFIVIGVIVTSSIIYIYIHKKGEKGKEVPKA